MKTLEEKANALIQRLRTTNEWRRGAETEMPDPKQQGEDIDEAIQIIETLRWRDVETDTPKEPYEVLVRSTKGNHAIATYTNLTGWVLKPSVKGFGSVIKWHPIETI